MKVVAAIVDRIASAAAWALSGVSPASARRFGLWYRTLPVRYPRWFRPLGWVKTVTLPGGCTMSVPFSEVQGMSLILEGVWQQELTERILSVLGPGDLFIDVGANMGYFTLLASSRVGDGGLVLAFEPEIRNLARLATNVAANGCRNVIVLSEAAGSHLGTCAIPTPPDYNTGVASLRRINWAPTSFNLAAIRRIDEVLQHVDHVRDRSVVVKIDAEGFEPEVISGMAELMRDVHRLRIFCELSPHLCDITPIVSAFSAAGLQGEIIAEGRWVRLDAACLPREQTDAVFVRAAA